MSLIVDEEKNEKQSNLGIKALPNLEFNFISANSLISLENKKGAQKEFEDNISEGFIESMRGIAAKYFNADSEEKKTKVKKGFETLQSRIINDSGFLDKENKKKFLSWNPFENKSTEFFDSEIQFGNKYFDIVIGNPPYIQLQKDGGKLAKLYEKQNFKSLAKTGDIYQLFYEKSLNLLNDKGVVSLITSNKWMRSDYGALTREYFYNNVNVFKLIDLGAGVFKSATVDTNIIFYSKSKEKINGERLFNAVNFKGDLSDLYLTGKTNETIKALEGKEWVIMDENEQSIFEKISKHKDLKDWDIKINYGVKTGFNEAFIIDEETKNRLIKEDKKSAELIKPILRGRDIKRYSYDFKGLYLINTHNGVKEKNILPVDVGKYKAIKKHLDKYYSHLETRQDKGDTPYNLRNCAYLEEFDKEKIVWTPVNGSYSFSFVDAGYYFNNSVFMITNKNNNVYELKYLSAVLNTATSKFGNLITPLTKIGNYTYGSKEFMETIPIPKPDKKTQKEIVSLVDKIIEGKKNGIITSEFESQIDSLVYKLYDLSEDEISIIENRN